MALIVTTDKPKTEYSYTPIAERDEEKPFSVEFKKLTLRQLAKLDDSLVSVKSVDQQMSFSQKTNELDMLKSTIKDWFNVEDADGKPVKIKKNKDGTLTDEALLMFSPYHTELANVIANVSRDPFNASMHLGEDITTEDEEV